MAWRIVNKLSIQLKSSQQAGQFKNLIPRKKSRFCMSNTKCHGVLSCLKIAKFVVIYVNLPHESNLIEPSSLSDCRIASGEHAPWDITEQRHYISISDGVLLSRIRIRYTCRNPNHRKGIVLDTEHNMFLWISSNNVQLGKNGWC